MVSRNGHAEFYSKYYGQLNGAKIIDAGVQEVDDYGHPQLWPYLELELRTGKRVTVVLQMDEEGNGPGFMSGLDFPGR